MRPALAGDKGFLEGFIADFGSRRDRALAHVRSIEELSCFTPEAAFYMMIRVQDAICRTDEHFALEVLEETEVLVDTAFNEIGRFRAISWAA